MTRAMPSRELSGVLQAVPAVATNFNSANTWVMEILVSNNTAGALTFTITDRQTSPQALATAISIPANSGLLFNFEPFGQYMPGGIVWNASGAGMTGSIFGFVAG